MNREHQYYKSIDTLVKAYFSDELQHGDCEKCAVGNLLKQAGKRLGIPSSAWGNRFLSYTENGVTKQIRAGENQIIESGFYGFEIINILNVLFYERMGYLNQYISANYLISFSNYSIDELAMIEYAFESADMGKSEDEYMFNGLMAVIDALDVIHENKSVLVSKTQKERFAACAI